MSRHAFADSLKELFPWAEFSADEDFYEDSDECLWHESTCYYDSEEDEWLSADDSFEDFRSKLNSIRSIDHAGEVAEYMLVLHLNEFGRAFLCVDQFVSNDKPYVVARPKRV